MPCSHAYMLLDTERLGSIVSPETSKQIKEARQQDTQLIHMTVQHLSVGKNYNCLSDYCS